MGGGCWRWWLVVKNVSEEGAAWVRHRRRGVRGVIRVLVTVSVSIFLVMASCVTKF
jgi:hypothetical protein